VRWDASRGNLDRGWRQAAVSTALPPREPGRHGWAELLTLVGAVRRLAFDRTLPPPAEALGRIRDAFADYDSA
jgi:hypothetical protein